jgi:hypothetical protein
MGESGCFFPRFESCKILAQPHYHTSNPHFFAKLTGLRFFRNQRLASSQDSICSLCYIMPLNNNPRKSSNRPRKYSIAPAVIEAAIDRGIYEDDSKLMR